MGDVDILRCPNCEAPYEAKDLTGHMAVCEYCGVVSDISKKEESPPRQEPRSGRTAREERHGHHHEDLQNHPVGTIRIVKALVDQAKSSGVDLSGDPTALKRLLEAARKASAELEHSAETDINLPFIGASSSGPVHLSMKVTRRFLEFDEL